MDGARILVVDDNEMNRDVLGRRLERQGHTIVAAEDGEGALEAVVHDSFDLILLDIMMPRMNGYQVLEHLKAHPTHRNIPVIVISALDDLESVVKCIELGADDYLFKPFNPVLLRARINACLSKKRLQETISPSLAERLREKIDRLSADGTLNAEQNRTLDEIRLLLRGS